MHQVGQQGMSHSIINNKTLPQGPELTQFIRGSTDEVFRLLAQGYNTLSLRVRSYY